MEFSVQLPTDRVQNPDEFCSADAIGEMAKAAEDHGFDACFVTDHPAPGDEWLAAGGHHTLDPFVALSFAAAGTERLRLQTNIVVLAYRNPFLTAKAVASLDVASGGRVILGVAAGYLAPEFAALGADVEERNELTDEAIDALKTIWSQQGLKLRGRHFEADGVTALPHPVQRPHPPIWVGGNSRRAIRRAVEKADGWLPFPAPRGMASVIRTAAIRSIDDLEERVVYAREHAAAVGRSAPLDIGFVPFGLDLRASEPPEPGEVRALAERLAGLGVTWLMVSVPSSSRAEYVERLGAFAEGVIRPIRGSG